MNKKNNRKGFTTVELVIVIAVIAILATVLIPTFSNLIGDATKAANKADADALYKSWLADLNNAKNFNSKTVLALVVGENNDVVYLFENNQLKKDPEIAGELPCYTIVVRADKSNNLPTGFSVAEHEYDVTSKKCDCGAVQP